MPTFKYVSIDLTAAGGSDDKRAKVSADDSVAGFLEEKIVAGSNKVVVTTANPGGDEDLEIDLDESNIDHDALLNYDISEHRALDDGSTTSTSLWSSTKIQNELNTKVDKITSTDNAITRYDGTSGAVQDSGIIIDDSDNITGVNNLTIDGDLTVNGTTTSVNSDVLDVTDANITVNVGGDQSSADLGNAGITVEMSDATDVIIGYDSSTASKFKIGEVGSEVEIASISHTQTLTNKTINADNNTISNIEVDNLKSGVLSIDLDLSVDNTKLAGAQAIKDYVIARVGEKDDASEISYTPSTLTDWNGDVDPGNVDDGLDQLADRTTTVEDNLTIHLNGGAGKHTASSITNAPAGNISATTVQAALNELDTEKYIAANFNTDFTTQFGTKDTDDLSEGSSNLYFTQARAYIEAGDIANTDFTFANNQVAAADITGLAFSNASTRAFKAIISVSRASDALEELFDLEGIRGASGWDISISSLGDESGVDLSITSAGQVQYTSTNLTAGGTITFRAKVTSI